MAKDSVSKGEKQITIRLPEGLVKEMMEYVDKAGQERLSYPVYFLLGFLYVHEIDKKDIGLALKILSRVVATTDNQKINRLYKALLKQVHKKL